MLKFLDFFTRRLRLANPWRYKVPALLAVPYFMLLSNEGANEVAYLAIAFSYCTIIGLAGLAYLFNDLGDRDVDTKAGKDNALVGLAKWKVKALMALFSLMALAPWFWFPMDEWSWLLLGSELLFIYLYAFHPFRLKERGFLGVVADALYAHLVPSLLAANTFYLLGGKQFEAILPYLIALGMWQFFLGIRNILFHQLSDEQADKDAGLVTVVTSYGANKILQWLNWLVLPLEGISFLGFAWYLTDFIPWFFPAYALFFVVGLVRKSQAQKEKVRQIAYTYLDVFYIEWYPILLLSAIIMAPIEVSPIFLAHLILFRNGFKSLVFKAVNSFPFRMSIKIGDWMYNHPGYLRTLARNAMVFGTYSIFFISLYVVLKESLSVGDFRAYQGLLSKIYTGVIIGHVTLVIWKRKTLVASTLSTYLFQAESGYNLAIVRFIFMYLIAHEGRNVVGGDMSSWAALPHAARESLPFLGWFIEWVPINPELYEFAAYAMYITCMFSAIGLFTRLSLLLSIPLGFYVWAVPCFFGKLNHNQLVIWIPMILAMSPCGDKLSIDAFIRAILGKRKDTNASPKYGLPLKIIWLQLAIIYCFSGIHKLWDTGLIWGIGDSPINQLYNEWFEHYDKIPAFRIDQYPWLVSLGSAGIMFGEIFYPVILFHPMLRLLGLAWGQAFHQITNYFVYIDFVHLRALSWSYVNYQKIGSTLVKIWHAPSSSLISRIRSNLPVKQEFIPVSKETMKSHFKILSVAVVLLGFNTVFSLFSIHTWPFSSYPTYSAFYEDYVDMVDLAMWDESGSRIDHLSLGEKANFRWENIRPFETEIIQAHIKKDTTMVRFQLEKYLLIWRENIKGLEKVSNVDAAIVRVPLKPENRLDTISRAPLMSISIHQ